MSRPRNALIRHCEGALATEAIQCRLLLKRKSLDALRGWSVCGSRQGSFAMTIRRFMACAHFWKRKTKLAMTGVQAHRAVVVKLKALQDLGTRCDRKSGRAESDAVPPPARFP